MGTLRNTHITNQQYKTEMASKSVNIFFFETKRSLFLHIVYIPEASLIAGPKQSPHRPHRNHPRFTCTARKEAARRPRNKLANDSGQNRDFRRCENLEKRCSSEGSSSPGSGWPQLELVNFARIQKTCEYIKSGIKKGFWPYLFLLRFPCVQPYYFGSHLPSEVALQISSP